MAVKITTEDVERFRTTDRHLELIHSGSVVRLDEMSTATRPAYAVEGRFLGLMRHGDAWLAACGCPGICDHALAAVEAELVRLFSLGAHAGYRAAKREAVR